MSPTHHDNLILVPRCLVLPLILLPLCLCWFEICRSQVVPCEDGSWRRKKTEGSNLIRVKKKAAAKKKRNAKTKRKRKRTTAEGMRC